MLYLRIFGLEFEKKKQKQTKKKQLSYFKSVPRICLIATKFVTKINILKFGTNKNEWFGYFFDWNLKILLSYLKSVPLNLPDCKIPYQNKILKSGNQNALFGYFWTGIWKGYCHIWNQHFWHQRSFIKATFCAKLKILKSKTKNSYLDVESSNFQKQLSYLKWASSNLSYYKACCKNKNP